MGIDVDGATIRAVRIALGGVAPMPWRLREAETALRGRPFTAAAARAAVDGAFDDARPRRENAFKVELAKRAVVRAMIALGAVV